MFLVSRTAGTLASKTPFAYETVSMDPVAIGRSSWKSGLGLPSAMIHTVSGMSAAMLATLATSPADTIKVS